MQSSRWSPPFEVVANAASRRLVLVPFSSGVSPSLPPSRPSPSTLGLPLGFRFSRCSSVPAFLPVPASPRTCRHRRPFPHNFLSLVRNSTGARRTGGGGVLVCARPHPRPQSRIMSPFQKNQHPNLLFFVRSRRAPLRTEGR